MEVLSYLATSASYFFRSCAYFESSASRASPNTVIRGSATAPDPFPDASSASPPKVRRSPFLRRCRMRGPAGRRWRPRWPPDVVSASNLWPDSRIAARLVEAIRQRSHAPRGRPARAGAESGRPAPREERICGEVGQEPREALAAFPLRILELLAKNARVQPGEDHLVLRRR